MKTPPPYTVAFRNEGGDLEDDTRKALEQGQHFVLSVMNPIIDPIPKSHGMMVVRKVVKLETGAIRDVVLRSMTTRFWQACIDVVNTPNLRLRVAAVGTPGVGKTAATPWLIRMLLEQGQTVVYLIRTEKNLNGTTNSFLTTLLEGSLSMSTLRQLQQVGFQASTFLLRMTLSTLVKRTIIASLHPTLQPR